MKQVSLILLAFLLISSKAKGSQMDSQTLISLLNFQTTLIQDAEISFLWYERFLTPPADVEKIHREIMAFHAQELQEVNKVSNPAAMREVILESNELYKTYGDFRYADENFYFKEINLVFQVRTDSTAHMPKFDYRMELMSRFENYPSLGFKRYFDGGSQALLLVNAYHRNLVNFPNQFANDWRVGIFPKQHLNDDVSRTMSFPFRLPPISIDESHAQMAPSEPDDKNIYVITHFPFENVMAKVFVRVTGLPEVIQENIYHRNESPNANEDDYWLVTVAEYSHFITVEMLGIVVPRVFEEKEYRADGMLRRVTKVTIKEMTFNQGLPHNFFDSNLE